MRKSALLLAVLLLGSALAPAGETPLIGLTFPSLRNEWYAMYDKAVKRKAGELKTGILSLEANNEVSRQISVVEDLIIKEVDGVLIVPIEVKAVIPAIESLNDESIPVVTVDRNLDADVKVDILAHVGADNVAGGRNAAKYIVEELKKKNGAAKGVVIELYGVTGAGPAIARSKGFKEVMDRYPEIKVFTQTASFMRAEGMRVMEDFILSTPGIDAVFAANDDMILGAIEAIDASGTMDLEKTILVGFDAMPDALASIREGILDATVEQYPIKQVSLGFEILDKFIRTGEKPAKKMTFLEPTVITRDNLDQAEDKNM